MIPLNLPQRNYIQGFWKLDEESGIRYDETDNHNDLQDNNTVLYGTGKIGNAADFERTNSEYLSITDALQTGLDITGEITICSRIKLEQKPSTVGGNFGVVSKYDDVGNYGYSARVAFSGDILYFTLSSNGSAQIAAGGSTALNAGTWYDTAFTLNQTTDKMQCYLNGVADGAAVAYTSNIFNNNCAFWIGNQYGNQYMDGLIDEVIIWNTCLTAEEVLKVKNISAYRYGGRFMPFFMSMREAYERHDKLWTPKGILIPEGI